MYESRRPVVTRVPDVDVFEREAFCTYLGEEYHVRDNGSALRQATPRKRSRPLDEIWTFGTPSKSDGYMAISGHKVHFARAVQVPRST